MAECAENADAFQPPKAIRSTRPCLGKNRLAHTAFHADNYSATITVPTSPRVHLAGLHPTRVAHPLQSAGVFH
ncbi:MAG: hypothetical protein J5654_04355 [Victivallales bacterium]|nr:hypothetical protein [Victivallales bacterium]